MTLVFRVNFPFLGMRFLNLVVWWFNIVFCLLRFGFGGFGIFRFGFLLFAAFGTSGGNLWCLGLV